MGGGGAGGAMDAGGVDARLERNDVANGGPACDGSVDRVLPSDDAVPRRSRTMEE